MYGLKWTRLKASPGRTHMRSPTMEWWWTIESIIVRYRSLVRNGSDLDQQHRCVLALNSMVTQAPEQPRAVIFGTKATTDE
eukprot:7418381-Pyramimonas_sp.AAC.1